jgi:hypothetical protein
MARELPVVHADAQSLADVLRSLTDLTELGLRGRAFVERWHDPRVIARRVVDDYERALDRRRAERGD